MCSGWHDDTIFLYISHSVQLIKIKARIYAKKRTTREKTGPSSKITSKILKKLNVKILKRLLKGQIRPLCNALVIRTKTI